MLIVNLYKSIEEFCFEQKNSLQETRYICPGPVIADGVRSILGSNAEVLTIAKWVNDNLKKQNKKRIMKSELLLRLSAIWRHYFPIAGEQVFFRAFEIFTDFRSFTLDQNLLGDVLLELDPDLKKSILLFWVYFETEQLIDEQLGYKLVSRDQETTKICFMGFKHMNAVQIDMLQSLSEFKDVIIAFPESIYKETLPGDWIRWLMPEMSKNREIENKQQFEASVVHFQKNKLNINLNEFRKKSICNIVIPTATMDISHFQEVLNEDFSFKTNIDLFAIERENIFSELALEDFKISEIKNWIMEKKKETIKFENYCALKVLMMIEESLDIFQELTESIDVFYLSVMKQVITLNSPRNYMISINENLASEVITLEEHRFKKIESPIAVIASALYGQLLSKDSSYNEKIVSVLSAIGPLKRSGLDFLFAKEALQKLISNPLVTLFLEDGLIDNDLSWREVLKNFQLNTQDLSIEHKLKEKRDIIKELTIFKKQTTQKFTASRLQTYLDCPRKYYFSYEEKISTRPDLRLSIDPDEKGNLEHKIIENYFSKFSDYNYLGHSELCKNILKVFLDENKVKLTKQLEEETYYELLEYTKNGITTLLNYQIRHPHSVLEFEISIANSEHELRGFVDCILRLENEVHIFDFKRSMASIGSKKELLNFEKIQLWIYKWALEKKYKVVWWGYINLSDGSITGISQEDILNPLAFDSFYTELMTRFKSENTFHPVPRHEKVCHYCELQLVCPKEVVS